MTCSFNQSKMQEEEVEPSYEQETAHYWYGIGVKGLLQALLNERASSKDTEILNRRQMPIEHRAELANFIQTIEGNRNVSSMEKYHIICREIRLHPQWTRGEDLLTVPKWLDEMTRNIQSKISERNAKIMRSLDVMRKYDLPHICFVKSATTTSTIDQDAKKSSGTPVSDALDRKKKNTTAVGAPSPSSKKQKERGVLFKDGMVYLVGGNFN